MLVSKKIYPSPSTSRENPRMPVASGFSCAADR